MAILGILTSHGLRREITPFPCCYKTDSLKPLTTKLQHPLQPIQTPEDRDDEFI